MSALPLWRDSTALSEGGSERIIQRKCWVHANDEVFWEWRRPMQALLTRRQCSELDFTKLLKRELCKWLEACDNLHLPRGFIIESRKSLQRKGALVDLAKDEWQIRTDALLVLLHFWSSTRKALQDRERGKMMLQAFLHACLGSVDSLALFKVGFPDCQQCQEPLVAGGLCVHASTLAGRLDVVPGLAPATYAKRVALGLSTRGP